MYKLVLVRHGESDWNKENRFTGWTDVDLSEQGLREARTAGQVLKAGGFTFDQAFTSVLKRAIRTLWIILDELDLMWIPIEHSWRLNERHYGALQGKDKKQTLAEYGEEQFMTWRRSFDTPPPPIADDDPYSQAGDVRYANLGAELPKTECLKDVIKRLLPYWEESVLPDLREHNVTLIAAHGNSLRAIVKHLDDISDSDIAGLNIPTGMPLVYELDDNFKPIEKGGRYLDPEAAAAAAAAVANQGR